MKTKKALLKRFKITKTGKILRRQAGQNHFLAKKSGAWKRKNRKWIPLAKNETKKLRKYLSM